MKLYPRFKGQTAIVTGAASGLGREVALRLSASGATLGLADVDAAGLEVTRKIAAGSVAKPLDVTDPATVARALPALIDELGGGNAPPGLDHLVLCAGASMWASFQDVEDLAVFRRLMEVNYLGTVHCVHAALPALVRNGGAITVVSSLQGELGVPGHTGYGASKYALNGFLEALEMELDGAVHILTVKPGWITGTALRENAYTADGSRHGEQRRRHSRNRLTTVTVDEAADATLTALTKRRREQYVPSVLRAVPTLRFLAPKLLNRLVKRFVSKEKVGGKVT